jgi:hypothetical protein
VTPNPYSDRTERLARGHAFADIRRALFNQNLFGKLPRLCDVENWRTTLEAFPTDDPKLQARFMAILDEWLDQLGGTDLFIETIAWVLMQLGIYRCRSGGPKRLGGRRRWKPHRQG